MRIPRVFHRIWLGDRPMPAEFRAFGRGWQARHPGWTMRLWTEDNLPPLLNRWAFLHATTLSGRANILRYEILFRHGGVYVDTDFECRRNLEPLIAGVDAFAGRYRDLKLEHGTFALANNALLGSVPGHPFFRDLVGEVEANMRLLGSETVVSAVLNGPVFLTSVLLRHPEVRLFPTELFYPYGPQERWRRNERFPRAYAVHHWTLSGLSGLAFRTRKISTVRRPCLTVAIVRRRHLDWQRLEWVLEGLCDQTVSDFEVLLPSRGGDSGANALIRRFRRRLRLRSIDGSTSEQAWRNRALQLARAPRVLFLDSDCLPDPDVVARHARYSDRAVLVYGFRRLYPAAKFFPFREAVDHEAIVAHARASVRRMRYDPARRQGWRRIEPACFSVPADSWRSGRAFDGSGGAQSVRAAARRAEKRGCLATPSLYGGIITQLQ